MKRQHILITSVGGLIAPSLLSYWQHSLGENTVFIGVDANLDAVGKDYVDHFEQVPLAASEHYIDAIVAVIEKYEVNYLLPFSDEEACILTQGHAQLPSHCALLASSAHATQLCVEKDQLLKCLLNHQVAVPNFVVIETDEQLHQGLAQLHHPQNKTAIKPCTSRGSRGFYIVDDTTNDFDQHFKTRGAAAMSSAMLSGLLKQNQDMPLLLMDYLQGKDFNIDVLCDQGDVIHCVIHERQLPKHGPLQRGRVINDDKILSQVKQAVKALSLHGLVNVEMAYSDPNSCAIPKIYEINPRPSAALILSELAGVPMLRDCLSLFDGNKVTPTQPNLIGINRFWRDEVIDD